MIHGLSALAGGFEAEGDVVVVGSGPGGSVAAANLAAAGMRVVVLEAGPALTPLDMTRDAPHFLARNFWEGGGRFIAGDAHIPSLQGRCLGGGSVVNSAIMMRLPEYVRREWVEVDGLDHLRSRALDDAYDRILARSSVTPTPFEVQGRRNLLVRDALAAAGLGGEPLPRAVARCAGSNDCITGCAGERKQSVDRTFLQDAVRGGAEVFTCAEVDELLFERGRVVGVAGAVVDPQGLAPRAPFRVRAPRVVLAAGAAQTPALLLANGISAGGAVGGSFAAHIGLGMLGHFDELVDPWIGATQGWGALSSERHGVKFESLWAPPALLLLRWGGLAEAFYRDLLEVKHTTVVALVYRAKVRGTVRVSRSGAPKLRMSIPQGDIRGLLDAARLAIGGLFEIGARAVHIGISRIPYRIASQREAFEVLARDHAPRDVPMTANHIFGSVPMSRDTRRGAVGMDGRLRGFDNVWVTDASLFPSPSGVNPQATVMALSDIVSRGIGELAS